MRPDLSSRYLVWDIDIGLKQYSLYSWAISVDVKLGSLLEICFIMAKSRGSTFLGLPDLGFELVEPDSLNLFNVLKTAVFEMQK